MDDAESAFESAVETGKPAVHCLEKAWGEEWGEGSEGGGEGGEGGGDGGGDE